MWQNSDWFYLDWGSSGLSFVFSQKRFCSSHLWLRQALASGTFPAALQEGDFIVPGDTLHCNDSRRNYTDFQGNIAVAWRACSAKGDSFKPVWFLGLIQLMCFITNFVGGSIPLA